jgi:hypothetical protein
MLRFRLLGIAALACGLLVSVGCSKEEAAPRTSITNAAATGAPVAGMVHGTHDPKYGGVVLMSGEMHYEVVASQDGEFKIYFSDAGRNELPASAVSKVKVAIKRPGFLPETVDLKISESGENWIGKGGFVDDKKTNLGISFDFQGQSFTSEMPYFAAEEQKTAAAAAK